MSRLWECPQMATERGQQAAGYEGFALCCGPCFPAWSSSSRLAPQLSGLFSERAQTHGCPRTAQGSASLARLALKYRVAAAAAGVCISRPLVDNGFRLFSFSRQKARACHGVSTLHNTDGRSCLLV